MTEEQNKRIDEVFGNLMKLSREELLARFANFEQERISKEALEYANRGESVKDVECPRGCLNPGLYFGYMAAYKSLTPEIEQLKTKNDNLIELNKESWERRHEANMSVAEIMIEKMYIKKDRDDLKKKSDKLNNLLQNILVKLKEEAVCSLYKPEQEWSAELEKINK